MDPPSLEVTGRAKRTAGNADLDGGLQKTQAPQLNKRQHCHRGSPLGKLQWTQGYKRLQTAHVGDPKLLYNAKVARSTPIWRAAQAIQLVTWGVNVNNVITNRNRNFCTRLRAVDSTFYFRSCSKIAIAAFFCVGSSRSLLLGSEYTLSV